MESTRLNKFLLPALLLIVGAGLFLLAQKFPLISDSIGYVYAAERLVTDDGLSYEDSNNQSAGPYFSLYAFQIQRDNSEKMYLGFPPGLPILLSAGIYLLGHAVAIRFFIPLLALLGVYMTVLLGGQIGERRLVGLIAAVSLVATAVFWEFGTAVWSEIPSMTLVTAGFYFFIRSRNKEYSNRQLILYSAIGGLIFVYSFFIRYANVMLIPAIGLYELFQARKRLWQEPARWVFFVIIGLGFAGMLLFNNYYYGGYTTTSYSAVHGWYPHPAFSLSYIWGPSFVGGYSLREALTTLWQNFSVFLVFVPLGWWKMKRPFAILVATSILITIAFYSIYAFAATGINSRFLLPVFPLIAISIAVGFVFVIEKISATAVRLAVVAVSCVLLFWSLPGDFAQIQNRNQDAANIVAKMQEMASISAPDAVFLSYSFNDQLHYYGDRSVLNYRRIPPSDEENGRYLVEYLEPCLVQTVDRLLEQNVSVYYVLDANPSFWNSFDIVQNNYETELKRDGPKIYEITAAKTRQSPLELCTP